MELQKLLEGVRLPATKDELLEHAVRQRAEPQLLEALRSIPDRPYERLDEVGEEVVRVQPSPPREPPPRPRDESGAPPGDEAYTDPSPEPGGVRADER